MVGDLGDLGSALDSLEIEDLPEPTSVGEITWSQKQLDVFEFVKNGNGNAVVEAVAGSGKTVTLVEALKYTNPNISVAFVAFNKRISDELRERSPDHVYVSTLHSLGLRNTKRTFPKTQVAKNKMWQLFDQYKDQQPFRQRELLKDNAAVILRLVSLLKAVLLEPTSMNMSYIVDHYSMITNGQRDLIYVTAKKLWQMSLTAIEESINFDDMIFAPAWGLAECEKFDFLFVDEAQDLNNSQIQFVLKSVKSTGRVVAVGDQNQCHPAGTLIAISSGSPSKKSIYKPIEELRIGDQLVGYNSRKSYFPGTTTQGKKVLQVAKRPYTGKLLTITIGRNINQCTPNHRWLTRVSKTARNYYALYLMTQGNRARIGATKMQLRSGNGIASRARQEKAEKAWLLCVLTTRKEAMIAEQIAQIKFGIPGVIFQNRGDDFTDQAAIDRIYQEIGDLTVNARKCLHFFHKNFGLPLWSNSISNYHVGLKSFLTQACNLIPGVMEVRTFDGSNRGGDWSVITDITQTTVINSHVYSLSVEPGEDGRRLYIADGIAVSNSCYGFRGADTDAIPNLVEALDATTLPLTVTYRCPTRVVKLAQKFVPQLEAREDAPEGIVKNIPLSDVWELVEEGDLVICRVNAPLVPPAFSLIRRGIKAVILGREIGKGLTTLIDKIGKRNSPHNVVDLLSYMSSYVNLEINKLIAAKKNSRALSLQDQFNTIVALADGCEEIREIKQKISKVFDDNRKGVTFSSIHKIKGGEAKRVFILEPQSMPHPMATSDWEQVQEQNIIYVAYTRAIEELYFVI